MFLKMNSLYPCLWFDGKAQQAAEFYCSIFSNGKITSSNPMVTLWEVEGFQFMGLNGGPMYKPNPSISFFLTYETKEEIDLVYDRLAEGPRIMMQLDAYPWSPYYAYIEDKFGISWQLYMGKYSDVNQQIVLCFLFTEKVFGKAEEAVHFYTKLFSESTIEGIMHYSEEQFSEGNVVQHSQFRLQNQVFMAMDGPNEHEFTFSEGVSLVIECEDQAEIDKYWSAFLVNGGVEQQCGWIKDGFGVSWQVVPKILKTLMSDPTKSQAVIAAFMQMKKFDIETLLNA
jgi:predicted 3-demethylubiquinone-9 3-methyltransferase (glyoxalase superfamily)